MYIHVGMHCTLHCTCGSDDGMLCAHVSQTCNVTGYILQANAQLPVATVCMYVTIFHHAMNFDSNLAMKYLIA